MQMIKDSDIIYYLDDNTLSYFKYKAGDYIPDDELYFLFSHVFGKIHSTTCNFLQLELDMGNRNKNNTPYNTLVNFKS
jgi:hypothetical protein